MRRAFDGTSEEAYSGANHEPAAAGRDGRARDGEGAVVDPS
jgi:hypothetical protein